MRTVASLAALLSHLRTATRGQASAYKTLVNEAAELRTAERRALAEAAANQMDHPQISPLVAAQAAIRAIGPSTATVDEAIVTSSLLRKSSARVIGDPSVDHVERGGLPKPR